MKMYSTENISAEEKFCNIQAKTDVCIVCSAQQNNNEYVDNSKV